MNGRTRRPLSSLNRKARSNLHVKLKRISVFCGSRHGIRPSYADAARALGEAFLRRRIGLVYGGGGVGIMGTVSETLKNGGGEIIGVIPPGSPGSRGWTCRYRRPQDRPFDA